MQPPGSVRRVGRASQDIAATLSSHFARRFMLVDRAAAAGFRFQRRDGRNFGIYHRAVRLTMADLLIKPGKVSRGRTA